MKLILTAAVDNLGAPGEVVEVKNGYGRNYLLPRGLAIVATRGAEKQIEGIKRAQEARAIRDLDHAREVRTQLEQLEKVVVEVKTSDKGKLFGSVTAEDIVAAVKKAGGPSLDKRIIELPKGLVKKTGNYQVEVKLHADVLGKINFSVVAA
ncbi:MAG: 50S ribosomal protein L9 [Corynebacterium casei]|uniref:Large ribosomal subunit protein bL9 n=1 Tax=Corynebacterium casei UCMA 3821 TaxID=1110505 RepID=G7HWT3_9CORY|nr:50S ribosomal protein L9 [Corynebacterium casei]MDN5707680.1 50S ribosomal protein L9 [Corynebacterium casei]MDN5729743.1 50S ribosomal protein L9 [Corynebacterium casei]MDN5741288.1 50S ribosomal protein L9 [Corynebacterium casei]MDN5783224.1 50S ribosomal protein L9 [Corynebacterium casei]MDN5799530.1 50S ribosomal protein L9 [Corynebacterium casei]